MIKLIASDIDGTLLPEGTPHLDPDIFRIIRELKQKGIQFVAASGRSYESVRKLFDPVADDLIFLVENGAYIVAQEKPLYQQSLDPELMKELIQFARQESSLIFYMVAGFTDLYTEKKNEDFIRPQEEGYGITYVRVDDLLTVDVPLIKCAMYTEGDAARLAERVRLQFGDCVNVTPSGAHWVDCIPLHVDKGHALRILQDKLGISSAETVAFGDNANDVPLLLAADESYAVEEGRPEAKAAAKYSAGKMSEKGVYRVLDKMLKELS